MLASNINFKVYVLNNRDDQPFADVVQMRLTVLALQTTILLLFVLLFYASVFIYADAECTGFCLCLQVGQRYVMTRMGRFSDALLHLRHQLIHNGSRNYATLCLLNIIQTMCNNGNIEGAKLMLDSEEKMAEIVRGFLIQQERFRRKRIENGRCSQSRAVPSDFTTEFEI